MRAVGRRGHFAREDWRGTEDVEDEEDTSPGRTGEGQRTSGEGQRTSLSKKGHPEQQRTKKRLSRTPRGHLEPFAMGPSPSLS